MWHTKITRDALLFALGTLIVLHELFLGGATERPWLLGLAGAALGLPFVFRGEDRLRQFHDRWGNEE